MKKKRAIVDVNIDDICGLAVADNNNNQGVKILYYVRHTVSISAGYHKANDGIEIRISLNAITIFQ